MSEGPSVLHLNILISSEGKPVPVLHLNILTSEGKPSGPSFTPEYSHMSEGKPSGPSFTPEYSHVWR